MTTKKNVLSTREVAELLKCSTRKIQKLVTSGKLSAHRDESGSYEIDKSELYRVYPELIYHEEQRTPATNDDSKQRIELLEEQVKFLKEMNELLKYQLDNATTEKSKLIDTLNSNQRLLEYHADKNKKKKWGLF